MENKIISTIKTWLPQSLDANVIESEYSVLGQVANYCLKNFEDGEDQMAKEAMTIIKDLRPIYLKTILEN